MNISPRWTAIREQLFAPIGLHWAGFLLLAAATLVLGVRVGLDWRTTSAGSQDALAAGRAQLRAMELQTAPLRGLDKHVQESRKQIDAFYAKRVPPSYSAILEALGSLQSTGNVRLAHVQYTQAPGSGDLTEIRLDASVTGDYPAILHFINGLERSQTFFVIRAMNLGGQQNGVVNLRLQCSTWLRPADVPVGLPTEQEKDQSKPATDQTDAQEGN